MTAPALFLSQLARRYRLERAVSRLLAGGAGGVSLAGLLHYAGGGPTGVLTGLITGLTGGVLAAWIGELRHPVDGRTVAQHLDRTLPEMEESAGLLIGSPEQLGLLAALQRARVERQFDEHRARAVLPRSELGRASSFGVPLALAGGLLFLVPPSPRGVRTVWGPGETTTSLTLRSLELEISPPKYTGLPVRHAQDVELEVEEGARLNWQLTTAGPVDHAWLIPSSGDSIPFEPAGEGMWQAISRADRSVLLRVRLQHGDSLLLTSDDYRLAVKPDRPPVLTIVRPEERTSYDPRSLPPVMVEVLANDDYGIDSVAISATIATGRGEAVRFRRMRLGFSERKRREEHGELLRATLDLKKLGLAAGDELYFDVEATDRKSPVANRSRSETVFISVRDSSEAPPADLARLAIGAQPEYFRSQRQLIIDTEKLLADQNRIGKQAFRERSNELGMDQGLLRLKYGQFLGEEFEEELQPMGGREHAASGAAAPDKQEAPKAGDAAPTSSNDPNNPRTPPQKKAVEEFTHKHDDAENATLLAMTVKDKLRAAVGAMWQSELKLRTIEPRAALPYMYQALELVKQVQQDSRAYVQRVGFEPPPIEVDKLRLTGKLKDIEDRQFNRGELEHDSLPAIRAALAMLQASHRGTSSEDLLSALSAAGQELSALAVDDPRLLPVLRDLRQLADSNARKSPCAGCVERSMQGLWSALPPAEPRLEPAPGDESPLARRFGALLRSGIR